VDAGSSAGITAAAGLDLDVAAGLFAFVAAGFAAGFAVAGFGCALRDAANAAEIRTAKSFMMDV
jgi:hypothetical protein